MFAFALYTNHTINYLDLRLGKEHGVGVHVSSVLRGSRADIAGLKVENNSCTT